VIVEALSAQFIDGARGRIFAVMHRPEVPTGSGVLIAPAFAEEMNKTRTMLAEVGRALRARGIATVVVDLYGTGDSEGEFRDATYTCWIDDLARAAAWSADEGWPIEGLLCVRLGCLLGAQVAREALRAVRRTVFWQPVVHGERFVTQFLRMRVAASMMQSARETVSGLRQRLRDGEPLEVAGYELSPELAMELDRLKLVDLTGSYLGVLHWMEVISDVAGSTAAASQSCLEIARLRGLQASVRTVVGAPFWATTEIVRIAELVDSTVEALSSVTVALAGNSST
jgi:exosortase A-associated hydrolase 2